MHEDYKVLVLNNEKFEEKLPMESKFFSKVIVEPHNLKEMNVTLIEF